MNSAAYYDTDRALAEYLLFHYGSPSEVLPWGFGPTTALSYPVRCVTECLDAGRLSVTARGLDLGCAVGRSTFELARHCAAVVGIDYSQSFIDAAQVLQSRGTMPFRHVVEGDLWVESMATVPSGIDRARVRFEHGDAQSLRADLGEFEVVLLANLLDRLREPRRCLGALSARVIPGGQLIVTTPCTWLEAYTPRVGWLGGFERDGRPVRTLDTLREVLEPAFELRRTLDLPFLIREHERKYQWSVAQATCWVRR